MARKAVAPIRIEVISKSWGPVAGMFLELVELDWVEEAPVEVVGVERTGLSVEAVGAEDVVLLEELSYWSAGELALVEEGAVVAGFSGEVEDVVSASATWDL